MLGETSLRFIVDLTSWQIADYEQQWRSAINRLAHGTTSSALMVAYRGADADFHQMYTLWRDDDYVYVQEQVVLTAELDEPFDPACPYAHVGTRIDPAEAGLPMPEWRLSLLHVLAAAFGFRWPLNPH